MTHAQKEAQESIEKLNDWIKPGDTIYTLVTQVAASGMSRHMRCFFIQDNRPVDISWNVARILGCPWNRDKCTFRVGGCGMDMGFHVVHSLSYKLHGYDDKGEIPEPSYIKEPTPECYKAGYSLIQKWL